MLLFYTLPVTFSTLVLLGSSVLIALLLLLMGYIMYFLLSQDTATNKLFKPTSLLIKLIKPLFCTSVLHMGSHYPIARTYGFFGSYIAANLDAHQHRYLYISDQGYIAGHPCLNEETLRASTLQGLINKLPAKAKYTKSLPIQNIIVKSLTLIPAALLCDTALKTSVHSPVATLSILGTLGTFLCIRFISSKLWKNIDKTQSNTTRITKLEKDSDE